MDPLTYTANRVKIVYDDGFVNLELYESGSVKRRMENFREDRVKIDKKNLKKKGDCYNNPDGLVKVEASTEKLKVTPN
jgi:hypothetical protein